MHEVFDETVVEEQLDHGLAVAPGTEGYAGLNLLEVLEEVDDTVQPSSDSIVVLMPAGSVHVQALSTL
jgi:hypothetical protein